MQETPIPKAEGKGDTYPARDNELTKKQQTQTGKRRIIVQQQHNDTPGRNNSFHSLVPASNPGNQ